MIAVLSFHQYRLEISTQSPKLLQRVVNTNCVFLKIYRSYLQVHFHEMFIIDRNSSVLQITIVFAYIIAESLMLCFVYLFPKNNNTFLSYNNSIPARTNIHYQYLLHLSPNMKLEIQRIVIPCRYLILQL